MKVSREAHPRLKMEKRSRCVEISKKTSKGLSFTYSFNLIADTNYVKTLDEKQVRQYLVAVGDEATAVDSRTVEELDDELDA